MGRIISKVKNKLWNRVKYYLPKKFLVKRYYRIKSGGKRLNLKNPQSFSDKLGWYKLYYRDELMRTCTDKASVREYVESCGYGDLLNECYGVYDRVEDIDWDALPRQFVFKNTLGGSGTTVKLVFDKETLDIENTKKMMQHWIDVCTNHFSEACEWVYEGRKARIIIEKLLIDDPNDDLPDYKFLCFNGKLFGSYFMRNCTGKAVRHEGEYGIMDRDFNLLPVHWTDLKPITEQPPKPKNYEKMVEIAEKLSSPFPHVRVDLYNIDGTIIFGELTFFTNLGYINYDSESYELETGKAFVLPERNH